MAPKLLRQAVQFFGLRYLLARELIDCGVSFNPLDKRYLSNPYPLYRRLREKDPVHRSRLFDGFVLTRSEDVNAVLRDARFSADDRNASSYARNQQRRRDAGVLGEEDLDRPPSMLRLDPPDHTRLRSLVNRAFTPRAVESLRPRVEAIVEELLDTAAAGGRLEVIRDLATPLPVIVIAEMLGIPGGDRERFKAWSEALASTLGFTNEFENARRARTAEKELTEYLMAVGEERRREPREDLLSALLAAEQEGQKLTAREVYDTCVLLLVAGNETTTNLIGNGLLALLRSPAQMALVRHEPALMPQAVEELLRYDSPVQATSRIALEDLEIGRKRIRRGQELLLLLGAANRDPEQFARPDELDVTRDDVRHLAFGHGIHFCLGAPLARLEAPIALNALLLRFPHVRLAERSAPQWGDNFILHGLRRLEVEF